MPDTGVIDVVLRQLRRVRRRHNAHALQRLAYGTIAGAALGASVVLALALRAAPPVFAAGTVVATILLACVVVALARRAALGWLRPTRAAAWVDRTTGLDGRLLTLVGVGADDDPAFVAELARQTTERLSSWEPARVVPHAVPRSALVTALGAIGVLVLTIGLAPRLRPPPPRILVGDRPIDWIAARGDGDDTAQEHLLAPGTEHTAPGDEGGAGTGADDDPGALQSWLRRELLGDATPAWEDGDASLAAASRRSATARTRAAASGPSVASDGPAPGSSEPTADDGPTREATPAHADAGAGSGDAPGAGTGTDPRLFGTIAGDGDAIRDRFELAIAARIRTRQAGPGAPQGDAPAAEPDRHPALGGGGRPGDPIHRMPVPVAWETLVRRLYSRRAAAPETAP